MPKPANACKCEQTVCSHGDKPCENGAVHCVHSPHGYFELCQECTTNMLNYLKDIGYKE